MKKISLILCLILALTLSACCGEGGKTGDCSNHGGVYERASEATFCNDGTIFNSDGEEQSYDH